MSNLHRFAEKAIKIAGESGERKREHAIRLAEIKARSNLANTERTQTGLARRQAMIEAGRETQHRREYGAPGIDRPGGFRYAELAGKRQGGAGGRDIFADRSAAYKQAGESMNELFPPDEYGVRKNPASGKPFTEKEWSDYTQSFADSALGYAAGGQPTEDVNGLQSGGFISSESGERLNIDAKGNIARSIAGNEVTPEKYAYTPTFAFNAPGTSGGVTGNLPRSYSTWEEQMARTPPEGFRQGLEDTKRVVKPAANALGTAGKYYLGAARKGAKYAYGTQIKARRRLGE
jgi:hypothetical protein